MSNKTEIAAGTSLTASLSSWGLWSWLGEHWLQLFSAVFVLATYATQVYFNVRRDRRESEQHDRDMNGG